MTNRVKELRERRGLTQKQVSIDLHIPQPVISRWEVGERSPSKAALAKLADYFGVSADYLLGLTDDETRHMPAKDHISDDDIKFALWGTDAGKVTDAQLNEVKRFAAYLMRQ